MGMDLNGKLRQKALLWIISGFSKQRDPIGHTQWAGN